MGVDKEREGGEGGEAEAGLAREEGHSVHNEGLEGEERGGESSSWDYGSF